MQLNEHKAKRYQRYVPRAPWRPGKIRKKVSVEPHQRAPRRPTEEEESGKLIPIPGREQYAARLINRVPYVEIVRVKVIGRSRMKCGSVLSSSRMRIGYWAVHLQDDNRRPKTKYLHHLILDALQCKKLDGMQVAHLNGNREDNRPSNLAWVTAMDNSGHMWEHGTGIGLIKSEVLARKIHSLYKLGRTGLSISKQFGCSRQAVNAIASGKSWRHLKLEPLCKPWG